ncbi:MAG: MlaD family protein [Desulfobaccales bacterium]|nr:MlaD family protein [Desulfobaccales bacterium]
MARKTSKFMVGLFVTLGSILAVVAIIWVGATKYFEKGNMYITYLDESVQGLQKDSIVKYRGVDVGRVEKIQVAPDNKLIGVVMKINLKEDLEHNAVAQLKAAGITGIMFVDLDRHDPREPDLSPKIDFPSEYPVIPSRPSEMSRIFAGINEIVRKFNQIETKGLSDQLIATTKSIETFFQGKEMAKILAKVEATAANLEKLTQRVDKAVAGGKLDEVLAETRQALKGTNTLITKVQEEISALKLPETMGKTRAIAREVETTSENLRRASETLGLFLERIYDRPPDLLFGQPPRKRWNE